MFSKEGGWKDSLPFIGLSEDIEVSQTSNKKILVEGLDWLPYLNNLSPNRDQISVNTVCRKGDENNKRKILARIKMSVVLIMSINTMVKKFYFTNL